MPNVPRLDTRPPEREQGEGVADMNLLQKWAMGSDFSDNQILDMLQDKGVISDLCYKLDQVVNDKEAVEALLSWGL